MNNNQTLSQIKPEARTYTRGGPFTSTCVVAQVPLTHSRKYNKFPGELMPLFCRHLENCWFLLRVKDHTGAPSPTTPALSCLIAQASAGAVPPAGSTSWGRLFVLMNSQLREMGKILRQQKMRDGTLTLGAGCRGESDSGRFYH